jgi:hypothetical protein
MTLLDTNNRTAEQDPELNPGNLVITGQTEPISDSLKAEIRDIIGDNPIGVGLHETGVALAVMRPVEVLIDEVVRPRPLHALHSAAVGLRNALYISPNREIHPPGYINPEAATGVVKIPVRQVQNSAQKLAVMFGKQREVGNKTSNDRRYNYDRTPRL